MEPLAYVGMGSFVLVSGVVGGRLLARWLRSGEVVELTIGSALFLAGGLGPALVTAAGALGPARPEARALCWGGGLLLLNLGASALCAFTWQVFHAAGRRAGAVTAIAIVAMFAGLAGQGATTGFGRLGLHDPFAWVSFAARAGAFGWTSWAAFREYRAGRRRLRLGLADPLVTNRFLLWSLGSGAAFAAFLVSLSRHLAGDFDPTSPIALSATPALGLLAATAISLTFFPPAAYRRRFART